MQVWSPSANQVLHTITLPFEGLDIKALAIYQGLTCTLIIAGTRCAKVIVWDVQRNSLVAVFKGHRAAVYCVCVANIASTSQQDMLMTASASSPQTRDLDFSQLCIASGGADRTVRTWDLLTHKRVKRFRHARSISSVIVTSRGIRPLLATAGVERVVKLWDITSGYLLRVFAGHLDAITSLALYEGAQMLLISGSSDHTLRVQDLLTGECVCILKGHQDGVLSLTLADEMQPKIVSSSDDLSVIQWDLESIIDAFYDNSEDGDGARNSLPPYLPPVHHTPTEELDKRSLSKAERKAIRRERKKAKRLRNLQSFSARQSMSMAQSSSFLAASPSPGGRHGHGNNNEDANDEDIGSFLLSEDEDEEVAPKKNNASNVLSALQQVQAQFADRTDDADRGPDEPEDVQVRSAERAIFHNKVQPDGLSSSSANSVVSKEVASRFVSALWSSLAPSALLKSLSRSASRNSVVPLNAPLVDSSNDNSSGVHLPTVNTSSDAPSTTSTQPSSAPPDASTTAAAPAHLPSSASTAVAATSLVKRRNSHEERQEAVAVAQAKHASFSMAVREAQLDEERAKNKAAEKLAQRLSKNRAAAPPPASSSSSALSPSTATSIAEDGGQGNAQSAEQQQAEFQSIKAEKLRQHRLQESRRKQSIMHAQQRSASTLQKRLEELAQKRKLMQQQAMEEGAGSTGRDKRDDEDFDMAEEGEDSDKEDEESDKEDEDSDKEDVARHGKKRAAKKAR